MSWDANKSYNLGSDSGLDPSQLWQNNVIDIGGTKYKVNNNGNNTVSFAAQNGGSNGGGNSADLQAQYDARQAEIEKAQREQAVRNETDSYLSGKKSQSNDIVSQIETAKTKLTSDLQDIYNQIDQAAQEKNYQLVSELEDEAGNIGFLLDKYDAKSRQEIRKVDTTNYNNARALNRTDTSLLSNLMSEPFSEGQDLLSLVGRTKNDKDDLITGRTTELGDDISNRVAGVGEAKTSAEEQIASLLEPVKAQQQLFANSGIGNYLRSTSDASPNKAAVDDTYNQILNLFNNQSTQAGNTVSSFGENNSADKILSGLTALTEEGKQNLYDTGEIDKSLKSLSPTEMPTVSSYQELVNQLALQKSNPLAQKKKEEDLASVSAKAQA